jgi:hypothetical protein
VEDVQVVAMLVRRCIAGDSAAWEEIVQTYSRRIYNICYRFAGIGRRRAGPYPRGLHQDVPHASQL